MTTDAISILENWFYKNCDGDWEHQGGITIETTDNPGWVITVEFDGLTSRFENAISDLNVFRSDEDYVVFLYDNAESQLTVSCSSLNLSEALKKIARLVGD